MSTIVGEIGLMAAENVSAIYERAAGVAVGPDQSIWEAISNGGWNTITTDPEVEVELRDILEVARTTGRYSSSTPLVPTLLAGRWFSIGPEALSRGATVTFRRSPEAVAPYWSSGTVILDGDGEPVTDDPDGGDSFALVAPLAILPASIRSVGGRPLAEARAAFLAVAVGCADAVIERAVDWVQTREQFGQTLNKFQAVRHHLANAHIAREQAWTTANAAVHELEDSARWARQGFTLARRAIELGIQVHGGIGFTAELGLQHYLNHVVQLDSFLGDFQ